MNLKQLRKIFRKHSIETDPKLQQALNEIASNTKPSSLQKRTNIISIIFTIVTFFLSIGTIILAVYYGESTAQITQLSNIAIGQQNQLKQLQKQSEQQSDLICFVADLIATSNSQNNKLQKQLDILSSSNKTMSNQLDLQRKSNDLADRSSMGKLSVVVNKFHDFKEKNPRTVKNYFDAKRMADFYTQVQVLLSDESSNSALRANETISNMWDDLNNEILGRQTDMLDEYHFHVNRIGPDGETIPEDEAKATAYRPGFSRLYDHFVELQQELEKYVFMSKKINKK